MIPVKKKCSKEDKEIILNNFRYTYDGIYDDLFGQASMNALFVILIWFILLILGIEIMSYFKNLDINLFFYTMFIFILASKLSSNLYLIYKKKRCLFMIKRSEDLQINGGTIIKIDEYGKKIYYLEDDTKNKQDEKYLLLYNASKRDCKRSKVGDRIGIIYGFNNQTDSINLIQEVKDVSRIIPNSCCRKRKILKELSKLRVYPHLSCIDLCKAPRMLTDYEKEMIRFSFTDEKEIHKDKIYKKFLLGSSLFIVFIIGIFLGISVSNVIGVICTLVGCTLVGIFTFYILKNSKKNMFNSQRLDSFLVSEAVYWYTRISKHTHHFLVYESYEGNIKSVAYKGIIGSVNYGDKLIKIHLENMIVFYKITDERAYACGWVKLRDSFKVEAEEVKV